MGSGFTNDVMHAENVDFSGGFPVAPTMTTNGQLLIASTASPNIKVGNITSPLGTITVGYSSPNITIDLSGGSTGIDSVAVQSGISPIVPTAAGLITINGSSVAAGTNPVLTAGTGANTMAVQVQISQAISSADATKIGLSNFNSAHFTVAATGFTSLNTSGGMPWTDVTGATQALSVFNGYVTDRGAGVTYTLPATATFGDIIKIDGKLGLTTIAQNANQAIRMGSSISTTGAGGSVVGTNVGDCITLRCTTGGASTIWIAENWVGSWTVT